MPQSFARTLVASVSGFSLICLLGLAITASAVQAEPIWRCRTDGGKGLTYQSTPCPQSGHTLPPSPLPSQEDRDASAEVAERERRLARDLARQRTRLAKNPPAAHASLTGPVRQVSVGQTGRTPRTPERAARVRAHQAQRPGRQDVFRAEVPGRGRRTAQAEVLSAPPP